MPGPNQITPSQLARLIGTPDCPTLIDVRTDEDFNADPRLIPTARRISHQDISLQTAFAQNAFPQNGPQQNGPHAVVICQHGLKLSHGAAAVLRCLGATAESLEGGFAAWSKAELPLTPASILAGSNRWVTRHRPKIDRIACPWLIRRFVNPQAEFLYVPPSEVAAVADRFSALPFDIENTFWSHRAETCSFDTMVTEFGLGSPAMDRLARIIRAADTDSHENAPQAAGLLALSVGLSRMYKDDLQQLDAAMPLYDALYRWARDGHLETHDWPAAT
ncbi:chromate resistance protein ChrB domain-containing protein [Pseudorhodobacter wandonensis]|uniref:chromate resistance protein ChrB domain-containing protein n=1 Tax=Pseudorhodobacter wandonensis TaxID=1120568 RepID=UPI00067BD3A2|nr:sulfurtransferase/chromate resistance protein [Pseudorhodobacter wandonensis]